MRPVSTAVLGLGLSGEAAAELLLEKGWPVTVFDDRAGPPLEERAERMRERGAVVRLGPEADDGRDDYRMVVVSPGFAPGHRLLVRAQKEGMPVISEVELASRFLQGRLIAVTGTNGKTTTVSLLAEIFRRSGIEAAVAGNIGYPLSRLARERGDCPVVVAEISSFQLERVDTFRPRTAVFLNLAPDHLDRYPGMKEYGEAKLKIFARQGKGDRAVFPETLAALVEKALPPGVERITWGGKAGTVRVVEGELRDYYSPGGGETICREADISGPGRAFRENALAAAAAARGEGVAPEEIAAVLKTFPGLPHRLEYVAEVAGVEFRNDSKATNPAAAAAALESFARPIIWLAGGRDKRLDFSPLGPLLPGRVKRAIFFGESRRKLRALAEDKAPVEVVSDLEEAVGAAFRRAAPGDVILLAPACASFDMFADYRARGDRFKSLVGELASRAGADEKSAGLSCSSPVSESGSGSKAFAVRCR